MLRRIILLKIRPAVRRRPGPPAGLGGLGGLSGRGLQRWSVHFVLGIGLISSALGQGTVQFANSTVSKVTEIACNGHEQVIIDAVPGTIIGLFAGPTRESLKLVLPVTVISTPGVFNGGVLSIPGTEGGQVPSWAGAMQWKPPRIFRIGPRCHRQPTSSGLA
jgi:hypothetical protein